MTEELKPCPFCGEVPDLPSGDGTQYEIECGNCAMAMASVQICDLMTGEERSAEKFTNDRYSEQYVERAKAEAIKQWNTRATLSPAHIEDGEEVEVVGYRVSMPGEPELGTWLDEAAEEEPQIQRHEPLMTVAQHQRIVAARSCPCQTDTARETRRKDGIEAAELQGILMRGHEACRPRDAGLMGWAAAALSAPPAADGSEPAEVLAARLISERAEVLGHPVPWAQAIKITAIVTKMSDDEKAALLALDDAPPAAGVPEKADAWKVTGYGEATVTSQYPAWAEADPRLAIQALYAAPTPPASEQQTVPRHKFEGLVEEVRLKDAEIDRLAERVRNLQAYRDGESGNGVWHWQGDGEDYLESLTCPIVIRAQDLRRLVASEQQRAMVMPVAVLINALERTRDTISMQMELVAARAKGSYLDKTPVMRSLRAHRARCDEALIEYNSELLRLNPHLAKGEGV